MSEKFYACIDLKSFYASVECVERGLDPFTANLVVADPARGDGAICLATSPALKKMGVRNRCRIFEIPKDMDFITALPRMKLYMQYSAEIYRIYLRYISAEDIHVYSIDECFIDLTPYLKLYDKTPKELVIMLINAVFKQTGICATGGIGTNLFLAKVALDITAKHSSDNIGYLDREKFEQKIWHHRPITDIWNIGKGTANRLEKYGIYDLYGVSHFSEDILYKEFGINAEYLIDHSHGVEPCTIADIHSYRAKSHCLSRSQILFENYSFDDALLVLREMVDMISLELTDKKLVTNNISLRIGYAERVVKSTGGSHNIYEYTNSCKKLTEYFENFFKATTKRDYLIRKITIGVNNIIDERYKTFDLFTDFKQEEKENKAQHTALEIKKKFGKNALIKGMNLQEKATAQARNKMIGGHNSGEYGQQ